MNRFTVEHRGATYETNAKVKVGDLVIAYFGREYPTVITTRVAGVGSEYEGPCRTPIVIVRGGRVL
jgi:hypothetical protein